MQTIAGNGVRVGSNDGVGGSPIDDFQDGPATSTALPYLFGGAYDRANNHLFVSGGDDILRLNLNNNTIARVAGNGVGVLGSIDGPGGDPRDDLVEGGDAFNTYVGFPAELVDEPDWRRGVLRSQYVPHPPARLRRAVCGPSPVTARADPLATGSRLRSRRCPTARWHTTRQGISSSPTTPTPASGGSMPSRMSSTRSPATERTAFP